MKFASRIILLVFSLIPFLSIAQVFNNVTSAVKIPYSSVDSVRLMAGIGAVDYDNDGDDDLILISPERPLRFYRNEGDFKFTNVTDETGLQTIPYNISSLSSADLDNDGWEDLIFTTVENQPNLIFKNNQDGTFIDKSVESGVTEKLQWGMSVAIADFNGDGFLDFYIGNNAMVRAVQIVSSDPAPNEFYLSQGAPFNYAEVAGELGVEGNGFSLAARFVDFDADDDLDLFVVNDFSLSGFEPSQYYENINGDMVEKGIEYGLNLNIFGMGIGYGDFDNDQDLDFYVSDIGENEFLMNQNGTFSKITGSTFAKGDFVSWGAQFIDANNDGLLDLIMTSGPVLGETSSEPFQYYQNIDGAFVEYREFLVDFPFYARGMAISDFDNDGDLDVMAAVLNEKDTLPVNSIKVLENTSDLRNKKNQFLQVQLKGISGNTDAIGAKLLLTLDDGTVLTRVHDIGGTYTSIHTKVIHFGLGEREIDELKIFWPQGNLQSFDNVPTNSLISITEGNEIEVVRPILTSAKNSAEDLTIFPTVVTDKLIIQQQSKVNKLNSIKIYALSGELVFQEDLENHSTQEISFNLPGGIYIVKIEGNKISKTRKIIIR